MTRTIICKLLQKKTYDILSRKHTIIFLFIGIVVIVVSILHFGETLLDWSREKYGAVFYPFSDNIAGKSLHRMLCQYVPIDVVYTWVNGTDSKHLIGLTQAKEAYGWTHRFTNSCTLGLCVESHMVLIRPNVQKTITLGDLEEAEATFGSATEAFAVSSPHSSRDNITVLVFPSIESAKKATVKTSFELDGTNYTVTPAFITDNWLSQNTVVLKNMFIVSNFSSGISKQKLIDQFPDSLRKFILDVYIHQTKDIAVLTVSDGDAMNHLSQRNDSATAKIGFSISAANLVVEPPSDHEDISASRFTDNEELRYSLRSLEKYAPWVQHIYIVTNGQIPYWLNLDNPRITIVTHEEIFLNKSHLPTFSSPAIECHLHRIPNLSNKFLYLNDDVMFGKSVWPEDFYSHTKGHKVYLSWPVPNCAEGCPSTWIRDGYCDKPCNNSLCQWDGGDCTPDNPLLSYQGFLNNPEVTNIFKMASAKNTCNDECANTWLADRYCDKACNVRKCGFDAGDCGVDNYDQITQLLLSDTHTEYWLPDGELVGFFNLTELISNNYTITEAYYNDSPVVRTLAVSVKYSVLSIILYPNYNTTRIKITVKCERPKENIEKTFFLTVSTVKTVSSIEAEPNLNVSSDSTDEPVVYEEFSENARQPKSLDVVDNGLLNKYARLNISASNLPGEVVSKIDELMSDMEKGELTEKGYWRKKSLIIDDFLKSQQLQNNEIPVLVYVKELNFGNIIPTGIRNLNLTKAGLELSANTSDFALPLKQEKRSIFDYLKLSNVTNPGKSAFGLKVKNHDHRRRLLANVIAKKEELSIPLIFDLGYETPSLKKRRLLDTFGDSLRHANKLYNEAFGYESRKVPSHIAHFVDKDVMQRLYDRFTEAFDATSSHRIRSSNDMQFAFSYYYYLMSERETVPLEMMFDMFDVDGSGTWSDREIRTLLTRLHDLPLDFVAVSDFEQNIINCSSRFAALERSVVTPHYERYYDSKLPTVTKALVLSCSPITDILNQHFGDQKRNQFEILGEEEVAFKMIHNNLSHVLSQIDDIRKNPKKFICLNDNMKHGTQEAEMIRAVIQDFYESLFPQRSQFELPPDYRNRFLYMDELKEWRKMRDIIRFATYFCLGLLIIFSVSSFWSSEVRPRKNRNLPKHKRRACHV